MFKNIKIKTPPIIQQVTLTFDAEEVSWVEPCGRKYKGLKLDETNGKCLVLLLKDEQFGNHCDCLVVMKKNEKNELIDSEYNFYNLVIKEKQNA